MGIEPGLQYGGRRRIQWAIAAPLLRTLFDLSLSLYLSALGRHVGRLRSCLCKDKNAKNDEIGMWNAYDPYLRFRYYLKNTNSFAIEQRQSISNLSNCCDYTMKDVFAKLGHLGVKSNVAIISTNLFLQSFSQFSFHLETTRERERERERERGLATPRKGFFPFLTTFSSPTFLTFSVDCRHRRWQMSKFVLKKQQKGDKRRRRRQRSRKCFFVGAAKPWTRSIYAEACINSSYGLVKCLRINLSYTIQGSIFWITETRSLTANFARMVYLQSHSGPIPLNFWS